MNSENNQEQGSFSSGILVGADHWNDFRDALIKEGKLSEAEAEITDYIKAARMKIADFLDECDSDQDSTKKKQTKKKTKLKKSIFKGI